jgi:Tol biopolymer transport system component
VQTLVLPDGQGGLSYECPTWSPDGHSIACEVETTESSGKVKSEIHVMGVTYGWLTGEWRVLSDRKLADGSTPSWSAAEECSIPAKQRD